MKPLKTLNIFNTVWLFLGIFQLLLIVYGCLLMPARELQNKIFHYDKLIHIFIYFVPAWWWIQLPQIKNKFLIISLLLFSISIEIIQPYFHRSFEYFDILANFSGMILGVTIYHLTKKNILTIIKNKFS